MHIQRLMLCIQVGYPGDQLEPTVSCEATIVATNTLCILHDIICGPSFAANPALCGDQDDVSRGALNGLFVTLGIKLFSSCRIFSSFFLCPRIWF